MGIFDDGITKVNGSLEIRPRAWDWFSSMTIALCDLVVDGNIFFCLPWLFTYILCWISYPYVKLRRKHQTPLLIVSKNGIIINGTKIDWNDIGKIGAKYIAKGKYRHLSLRLMVKNNYGYLSNSIEFEEPEYKPKEILKYIKRDVCLFSCSKIEIINSKTEW